jgi:hypothetical protein
MQNRLKVIALSLGLSLATSMVAQAMSQLTFISVTPLWPTNSNPGNLVLYEVVVERTGQGFLNVEFSASCLPDGCNISFDPDSARFTGRRPQYLRFIMGITGNQPEPTDTYAFTVTGTARRESFTFTNSIQSPFFIDPSASSLVSLNVRADGDVELRGLGYTGQTYDIEATDDLANPAWTTVGSCTADGNGRFTFIHEGADAKASSMRFYRAVKIAPANP